jgi:glutamyl-tRNA reductase
MTWHVNHRIERFCVVGVSYKKADTVIRSLFSLNERAMESLYSEAKNRGLKSLVIVNTCNRVEIFACAPDVQVVVDLMLEQCFGANEALFNRYGYRLNGRDAFRHAFRVGAGLESQILGDFEIVGQLKQSLKWAESHQMVGPVMHRTFNYILQASKRIKNETAISKGTASVSFAAVDWINKQVDTAGLHILLIGAGTFGKTVLKNVMQYCPFSKVSISNRTPEKAIEISNDFDIGYIPFENLAQLIDDFDIIICCTNATSPIVQKSSFHCQKSRWIIDLSIPANVSPEVQDLPGIRVVNVDEISKLVDSSIELRKAEVPKANKIIEQQLESFLAWLHDYRNANALADFRKNLLLFKESIAMHYADVSTHHITFDMGWEKAINERVGLLVNSFKHQKDKGCQMILAYDNFLKLQTSAGIND